MRQAWAIALKEWRRLGSGRLLYLVLVQPLIFCFVWGYCASLDLRTVELVVMDEAGTAESREVVRALESTDIFRVVERPRNIDELRVALDRGAGRLALILPARFDREFRRHQPAPVQLIADGTDPVVANLGLSYASRVLAQVDLQRALERQGPSLSTSRSGIRTWYNPSLRSADVLMIGAICFNAVWFLMYPAISLLLEKENGTLFALRASPLRALPLWAGTIAPHLLIILWGSLVQIALAVLLLEMPIRGSGVAALLGISLLGFLDLNVGCIISVLARGSAQVTIWGLLVSFIAATFSGFFVPITALPEWGRRVADWVPLRHAVVLMRNAFLKPGSLASLSNDLLFLGAGALVTSLLAVAAVHLLLDRADA